MPITFLDIILIGIMLISALLALMRGFTREVLSIIAWAGGAIAAWFLIPVFKLTARTYFHPDQQWLADIVLGAVIFIVVFIVLSVLTMRLSDWVLDSGVGVLDRTLGFLFGLARGLVLIVVAYLMFIWLVPRADHPDAIRNARTLPLVQAASNIVVAYMPAETAENLLSKMRDPEDSTEEPSSDGTTEETPTDTDSQSNNGYNGNQRSGLNQLLESTQSSQN